MASGGRIADASVGSPPFTRLALFAMLWACATLFHLGGARFAHRNAVLVLAALLVIAFPRSTVGFLAFLCVQAFVILTGDPVRGNHWLFSLFVSLTILTAAAVTWLRGPLRAPPNADALLDSFAPVVRAEVLLLYAFAVLHKLNHGFLDPAWSCAVVLAPSVPPWVAIAGGLGVEAAIFLLLAIPRSRNWGVLLGGLFHTYLGATTFSDFSSMVLALYVLFMPADLLSRAQSLMSRHPRLRLLARAHLALILLATGCVLAAWVLAVATPRSIFEVVWLPYALALLTTFLVVGRPWAPRVVVSGTGHVPWPPWLMTAVVAFNGLCPYLGLKTECTFSMFSNLRTEGGVSNHLLVPATWQVAPYQRDLVTVKSSSDLAFWEYAESRVPYLQLRDAVSSLARGGARDLRLTYVRAGVTVKLSRAEEDPELSRPLPWAAHTFMRFRLVPPEGAPDMCEH
jgi:hypothetical protein